VAGCASAPLKHESGVEADCIKLREINAIDPLDDEHAFVRLSATRHYLVTIESGCKGFSKARSIAFVGAHTRVCADGGSLLEYEYPTVGTMRCRVVRIQSATDKATAREMIEEEERD
jgi:hypothetical protein